MSQVVLVPALMSLGSVQVSPHPQVQGVRGWWLCLQQNISHSSKEAAWKLKVDPFQIATEMSGIVD